MSDPETRYARTEDGFHIAYQVAGEEPVDIVFIPGWFSNVDLIWDEPDIAPVPGGELRGGTDARDLELVEEGRELPTGPEAGGVVPGL
jgi:hypothetical protein